MNQIIKSLFDRKSIRVFTEKNISQTDKELIIESAIQAPTAGNQSQFTILDIEDKDIRKELAFLCDDQPFITKAPWALVFLADTRKWIDCYEYAGVEYRKPALSDLMLACEDAMIAAQNSVVAAESLGIGSCYIGDIVENKEQVVKLLNLDKYVFPITMLVFGYPTEQQKQRVKPKRFDKKYIVQKNTYSRMPEEDLRNMFENGHLNNKSNFNDFMEAFCKRKYMSDFSLEMKRSVKEYLKEYL